MPDLKQLMRTAIAVLIVLVIASMFTHNAGNAAPAPPKARGYYLTTGSYAGNAALNACTAGYHMASPWEIGGMSSLRYDTALGRTAEDSGGGPPFDAGWTRTGNSSGVNQSAGANCAVWSSNSASDYGTGVQLLLVGGSDQLFKVGTTTCDSSLPVWCVQD